ncbi:hypothetical protein MJO29_006455, partial [Puccinia striiformis f. sp. tritici]
SPMTPRGWNKSATRMEQECNKDGPTALWILLLIHYHAPADLVMPEPPVTAVTKLRAKKGMILNTIKTEVERKDVEMCKAWAAITEDSQVGTNQELKKFWARIHNVYKPKNFHLQPALKKAFKAGCAIQVKNLNPNGRTLKDKLEMTQRTVPNGAPTVIILLKKKRPKRNVPKFPTTTIEPCRVPLIHRLLGQIQFPPMLAQSPKQEGWEDAFGVERVWFEIVFYKSMTGAFEVASRSIQCKLTCFFDSAGVLNVSDAFPLPLCSLGSNADGKDKQANQKSTARYTASILPRLSALGADANVVGFYCSTVHGQHCATPGFIETLISMQINQFQCLYKDTGLIDWAVISYHPL